MRLIGENQIVFNEDTVYGILENFINSILPVNAKVEKVEHKSYDTNWKITIVAKEINIKRGPSLEETLEKTTLGKTLEAMEEKKTRPEAEFGKGVIDEHE